MKHITARAPRRAGRGRTGGRGRGRGGRGRGRGRSKPKDRMTQLANYFVQQQWFTFKQLLGGKLVYNYNSIRSLRYATPILVHILHNFFRSSLVSSKFVIHIFVHYYEFFLSSLIVIESIILFIINMQLVFTNNIIFLIIDLINYKMVVYIVFSLCDKNACLL